MCPGSMVSAPGKVCDCARNFKNAVMGAGAEALLHYGPLQQVLGVGAQLAVFPDLAASPHLRVGVDAFALVYHLT